MSKQVLPDPLHLSSERFKLNQLRPNYDHDLGLESHIKCASGQLLEHGLLSEVTVILESKQKMTTGLAEVNEIAACLSRQKDQIVALRGVLRCLRYRSEPLELYFKFKMNVLDSQD